MATEKRLIYSDALYETIANSEATSSDGSLTISEIAEFIEAQTTVDAVVLPCKIGDFVWAIRNYKGKKHPQRGIVSDMFYMNDMSLQIVVKHVSRGKWGKTVFATDKEAYDAIGERKDNG